jgi:nitrilase
MNKSVIVGIIQDSPVYQDLDKSMQKAQELARQAAANKAQLIVFGETWLSGYPAWLDSCDEVNYWDHEPVKEIFARTYRNSVEVPGNETDLLCKLAKELKLTIIIGVNEKISTGKGNGSLYNSLLTISKDGNIANHHRKLVPTFTEKMVWAPGDGPGR